MKNIFHDCDRELTLDDIKYIEDKISYSFPIEFISHYLEFNGGIPERSWWDDSKDTFEPIEVSRFKSIKYNKMSKDSPLSLIDGCYISMVNKEVIPSNLIPFANDWGGNFFCIDKNNGNIIFYATDSFDEELTMKENHRKAQRFLTLTFDEFKSNLVTENELD